MNLFFNFSVLVLLTLSFGVQEFMPIIDFANQARLLLPAVFFFCASLSVSFPMMLILALAAGLVWDARNLPYPPEKVTVQMSQMDELGGSDVDEARSGMGTLKVGYSIVFFGIAGALMQGIRPLFKRGRWEFPVFMVGIATFTWLLVEFLFMSFLRGSFEFHPGLWTKLITCSLLAMLVSPIILFVLHILANLFNYEVKHEGLVYRYHGS
jgi:hypothetical protein